MIIKSIVNFHFLICALVTSVMGPGALAQTGQAENQIGRPIRLIVPANAGHDMLARQAGAQLSQALSKPVPIINMPGAGGGLAIASLLTAPANGETLVLSTFGSVVIAPLINSKLGYTHEHLTPLALLSADANVLFTASTNPITSLADLRKKSTQPRAVKIGHIGVGSAGHLLILKLEKAWKTQIIDVPYKLSANALRDLAAGEIDAFILATATASSLIKSQMFTGLAISDSHRHPCIPQVRTFKEQGLDLVLTGWWGLFVSSQTPEGTVQHLRKEWRKIQGSPEFKESLNKSCYSPSELGGHEFAQSIDRDVTYWRDEIQRSGLDKTTE